MLRLVHEDPLGPLYRIRLRKFRYRGKTAGLLVSDSSEGVGLHQPGRFVQFIKILLRERFPIPTLGSLAPQA